MGAFPFFDCRKILKYMVRMAFFCYNGKVKQKINTNQKPHLFSIQEQMTDLCGIRG